MLQVRSPRNLKLALMKSGEGEQQIESAKNIVYRISFLTYKRTAYDRKKVFFYFFSITILQLYNHVQFCYVSMRISLYTTFLALSICCSSAFDFINANLRFLGLPTLEHPTYS